MESDPEPMEPEGVEAGSDDQDGNGHWVLQEQEHDSGHSESESDSDDDTFPVHFTSQLQVLLAASEMYRQNLIGLFDLGQMFVEILLTGNHPDVIGLPLFPDSDSDSEESFSEEFSEETE